MKTRIFPENNYKAIWHNGKTLRFAIDPKKPITELDYPEFYDIKITSNCEGNCPYCYMDSKESKFVTIIPKVREFFGKLTKNQRPFQVAIGGGEPTSHPSFLELLKVLKTEFDICPNYTTNGMWTQSDGLTIELLLHHTSTYCGGVAVSCHPHLINYWEKAIELYKERNIKLNLHIIISDKESIDYFKMLYERYNDAVDYFVLLPYGAQGRAKPKEIDWEYLVQSLPTQDKIAFGANFYPYLLKGGHNIKVSLYEPEIMSKFLDLETMKVHKSSFNLINN